ncbi:kinase-like domain-containing protein [Gautieria morchelliformis]|nr:kinase-like domain-containing protein [Gautieria morchelliformis]
MPRVLVSQADVLGMDDKFTHFIIVWKENGQFYIANHPNRVVDNTALEALEGKLIPEEHMHPVWQEEFTQIYVKRPDPIQYSDVDGSGIPNLVANEVRIMEILATNPHPNVVTYYGCVREGQYVTGICLKKYICTLDALITGHAPEDGRPPYTKEAVLGDIRAGLDHIHSLGYVHDDINPRNIMLDDQGQAVIIDFDSCSKPGEKSRGGTYGWSKSPQTVAIENDEYGFGLIERFIRGDYDGTTYI